MERGSRVTMWSDRIPCMGESRRITTYSINLVGNKKNCFFFSSYFILTRMIELNLRVKCFSFQTHACSSFCDEKEFHYKKDGSIVKLHFYVYRTCNNPVYDYFILGLFYSCSFDFVQIRYKRSFLHHLLQMNLYVA